MREAEIKIWIITGDKVETAEKIGHTSGLLTDDMKLYKLTHTFKDSDETLEHLKAINDEITN